MVTAAEIRDEASLRAWLEGRPREDAVAIAARAALRVLPNYQETAVESPLKAEFTEMALLQLCIVPSVAAARLTLGVKAASAATARAASSAHSAIGYPGTRVAVAAKTAARAADAAAATVSTEDFAVAASAARSAACSADSASSASGGFANAVATNDAWTEVVVDAVEIEAGRSPFRRPLWHGGEIPAWVPMVHRDWRGRGAGWDFWADWYEGYLTGRPLDLDLLEKVALIPDEEWKKGDVHVNAIIAGFYHAHRVAAAAARLEADLVATVTATPGIGHNRPPEDIFDFPLVVPAIQEPLRAIRNQALAPRPDKDVVLAALATLQNTLAVAGRYAAGKLDLAVDESIKSVVPWAWKAVIGWFAANQVGLIDFIKQATQWLAGL